MMGDRRRRLLTRCLAATLLVAVGWPLTVPDIPASAAADCGSVEVAWPQGPEEVRGLTFTGTALEVIAATPAHGPRVRFGVDEVLDGAIGSTIDIVPWCVGTRFEPGRRYLISTSDTLPLPGSDAASPSPEDGLAWFTDPTAVAWRIRDGGKVGLLGYAKGSLEDAPTWLRRPRTVRQVARAILPDGGDPDPFRPASHPSPTDPPGVRHEALGTRSTADWTRRLELLRTTLAPGATMPPTRFAGDWLVRPDHGRLTVTLIAGSAVLGGPAWAEEVGLDEGMTVSLGENALLMTGPDAILTWQNQDAETVRLLSVASIPGDRPTMMIAPDDPADSATSGPVIKRHVVTGTTLSGGRSRITVADRSGRIVGVRIPTERELRFAGPGWPSPDGFVTLGPVVSIGRDRSEVLIRSLSTPCGPVVTVDVAQDLSAIKLVDRTPGCDAMGVGYALVLRVRGAVADAEDIELSRHRRR